MGKGDGLSVRDRGESQSKAWHDEHPARDMDRWLLGPVNAAILTSSLPRPGALTVASCIQAINWRHLPAPTVQPILAWSYRELASSEAIKLLDPDNLVHGGLV